MKKSMRKVLCLCLVILMAFATASPISATDLDSAQGQADNLEDEKQRLENKLEELEALKGDTEKYIEEINAEITSVTSSVESLNEELAVLEETIEQVKVSLAEAEEKEEIQYEEMKLRIQYVYEMGDTTYLQLLFSASSISEFLNKTEYIYQLNDYDRNMLLEYQETKQYIANQQQVLEDSYSAVETAREELSAKEESLMTLLAAKNVELADVDGAIAQTHLEISNYDDAIAEVEDDIAAIVAEFKRQEEQALANQAANASQANNDTVTEAPVTDTAADAGNGDNNADAPADNGNNEGASPTTTTAAATAAPTTAAPTTTAAASSGSWTWPAPACRIITDGYGGSRGHKGIDIAKSGDSTGQTIVAAVGGKVAHAGYSSSAGNWIVIYHGALINGQDTYTCYMHCNTLNVSTGQVVAAGQTIGTIGNTGQSSGAHLHFEIRLGSFTTSAATVNPLNYVSP